jgi:hypothetical protein
MRRIPAWNSGGMAVRRASVSPEDWTVAAKLVSISPRDWKEPRQVQGFRNLEPTWAADCSSPSMRVDQVPLMVSLC